MFDREKAIQELIDNDFSDIFNLGQDEGYFNMTVEVLMQELEERGISYLFGDDDYDGQPDEAQEWHDFDADC